MAPFSPQAILGAGYVSGGGGGAPALPTLTSSGQTQIFRLYTDTPAGHLYQDNALTVPAVSTNDPVFGIKDLSAAHNNFADTVASHGGTLHTTSVMNNKQAILFDGAHGSIIESDNSTNINVVRTATNIALLATLYIDSTNGTPQVIAIGSIKSKTDLSDSFCLRLNVGDAAIFGGRFGSDGGTNSPLYIAASTLNAGWSSFDLKTIKLVLRACPGSGNVQKLDIAATDGTTPSSVHSVTYTNASGDTDGASTPWDYFSLGGLYYGGSPTNIVVGYLADVVMWLGTSQMNDADVAALLTYAAGTAGF